MYLASCGHRRTRNSPEARVVTKKKKIIRDSQFLRMFSRLAPPVRSALGHGNFLPFLVSLDRIRKG